MLLLAMILLVPWRFEIQADNETYLEVKAEFKWAAGLLGLEASYDSGGFTARIRLFGLSKPLSSGKKMSEADATPKKPKRKRRKSSLSDYLNRSMIASFTRLLHSLIKALHLDAKVSGSYGFEEPDITAMSALLIMLLGSSPSINLKADYSQAIVDVRGYIRGRIIIAQMLGIGIQFLVSKPVRAIWWPKIKIKRKRKEIIQYV